MPSIQTGEEAAWIVGAGASGSEGFREVMRLVARWPPDSRAALLVVLHRPADAPSQLPELLRARALLPVVLAREGDPVSPGVCYVGPPDKHLAITDRGRFSLAPDHAYRNRTIDLLFGSLAAFAAPRTIGVVLAGALDDGTAGATAIHAKGGLVMVSTPHDSFAGGMQRSVVKSGCPVEFVGSPEEIAAEVQRVVSSLSIVAET